MMERTEGERRRGSEWFDFLESSDDAMERTRMEGVERFDSLEPSIQNSSSRSSRSIPLPLVRLFFLPPRSRLRTDPSIGIRILVLSSFSLSVGTSSLLREGVEIFGGSGVRGGREGRGGRSFEGGGRKRVES